MNKANLYVIGAIEETNGKNSQKRVIGRRKHLFQSAALEELVQKKAGKIPAQVF